MNPHPSDAEHLSEKRVADYVNRRLSEADRTTVIEHLASCAECRDEALAAARVLRAERTRKMRSFVAPVATAIALGVVLLVVIPRSSVEPTAPAMREGASAGAEAARIEVHAPGSAPRISEIEFTWEDMGSDVRYRFSLTGGTGREVWSAATADTSLVLPPEVTLSEGTTYFWWVDALLLDGRSVTTGVQRFAAVP